MTKAELQSLVERYQHAVVDGDGSYIDFVLEDEIEDYMEQHNVEFGSTSLTTPVACSAVNCDDLECITHTDNIVPHDAYWLYLAYKAFTVLDAACYEVVLGQDFGDEQSEAWFGLLDALKEWK